MTRYSPDRRRVGGMIAGAALAGWAGQGRTAEPAPTGSSIPDVDRTVGAKTDPSLRMTAPVTVNGQGPYPFVVDTGANRSVISVELARTLNLPAAEPAPLHSVAGVETVQTVRIEHLAVSGLEVPGERIPVLPGARLGAQGLLGVDGLGGRRLIMDFRKTSLTITAGEARPKREPLLVEIPAHRRFGQLMIIDAAIEQTPIVAFLDSGAQSTVGNLALYNRVRSGAEVLAPRQETLILSATDQTAVGLIGTIPALRLGRLIVQTTRGAFADLHAFELWDLIKKPAILLGMDVLRHFDWVEMDYARSVVGFRLNRENYDNGLGNGDVGNKTYSFE
jgi:predicted aspartyl protease